MSRDRKAWYTKELLGMTDRNREILRTDIQVGSFCTDMDVDPDGSHQAPSSDMNLWELEVSMIPSQTVG